MEISYFDAWEGFPVEMALTEGFGMLLLLQG